MNISQADGRTRQLTLDDGTIVYDLIGEGPLIVLAHGMGDSRHSYRFVVPGLVSAGYRVANVDLRGCGDSSTGWQGYSRTNIAGDLVALVRHLGGPAVLVGQSISGGAATIAAATAPELIIGLVEVAPFTRKQSVDLGVDDPVRADPGTRLQWRRKSRPVQAVIDDARAVRHVEQFGSRAPANDDVRYPWAMVEPYGPAVALTGSTWIHWWSSVTSANAFTRAWSITVHSVRPRSWPAAWARASKAIVVTTRVPG